MKLKCLRDCAVVIKSVEKVEGEEVARISEIGFRKDEVVSDKSLVDLLKADKNFAVESSSKTSSRTAAKSDDADKGE